MSASRPTIADVTSALLARAPEHRIEPSLERIRVLLDLLGDPQRAAPVMHLTGTNGKSSTARMIDALLRATGLRVGLYTSPHLLSMTERIQIDGSAITEERLVELFEQLDPVLAMADRRLQESGDRSLTFFEVVTALAFMAFADAPVDVAVIEVGLGGSWDATNLADAAVAVVTPIELDHTEYLGETLAAIAGEKAGIIKPDSVAVLAHQHPEAAEVLLRRCAETGAQAAREGLEFGVLARSVAVGGQLVSLQGLRQRYDDLVLPLFGAHQAGNAAVALAAVEALLGSGQPLADEVVREAFGQVASPGRLEVLRRSPSVVVDAAHNPSGAAALAESLDEAFAFAATIGVVAVLQDKDADGILAALEPAFDHVVCTTNTSSRALPAAALARAAEDVFGGHRVSTAPDLVTALDAAMAWADEHGARGSVGIVATGSVVTAAEVRALLGGSA